MNNILIVEDDLTFGTIIQKFLDRKGYATERVTTVKAALQRFEDGKTWSLVLSDMRLPDHDGMVLLQWLRKHAISVPFIVMTSYAEVQNVVLAMKSGATDYIAKPFSPDVLMDKITDALKHEEDSIPISQPKKEKKTAEGQLPKYIEGESEASKKLYDFVALVAPTPMSVLILGASGAGKEYVAHRIHELSTRCAKPFFALDCGAIPKDVAVSELFGHVRGAFTGAEQDKKGAFEIANGGTLFLDEVGNLNYEVQVQLLRALQERKIRPLGGTKEVEIDIRLVCATNENLAQRVQEGKFREDLYHRINEFTITMPALKDRGADLLLFADLFLRHANKELGRNVSGFDHKATEMMMRYDWPGNLRELNNVVKRATLLTKDAYIGVEELEQSMNHLAAVAEPLTLHNAQDERQRIEAALKAANGNKSKAAVLLAIDRKTLYNKMRKYGM